MMMLDAIHSTLRLLLFFEIFFFLSVFNLLICIDPSTGLLTLLSVFSHCIINSSQ